MNGPNLTALAFVLLGIGCVLMGVVLVTFLVLHGPNPAMETLEQAAPVSFPGLLLVEALSEQRPTLFWAFLTATFILPATLFGASGVMIWLLVGRPLRSRQLQEAAQEPHREDRLQALIRDRLEGFLCGMARGPNPAAGAWVLSSEELDAGRWQRLELFLRESGLGPVGFEVPAGRHGAPFGSFDPGKIWAHVLIVVFLGLAVFGFLSGVLGALFFDQVAKMAPFPTLPHEGAVFLLFTWLVALLALIAAGGVKILSALDRKLLRRWVEAGASAQERLLAAYDEQIDRISDRRPGRDDQRLRWIRALTVAALPGLDGLGKGSLLETASRKRLLGPQADLGGADLQEARLSGLDLAGLHLREANLCRACLEQACLAGADLTGADLRGADLRGAGLTGATLHRANLYRARLHGAVLCRADLSSANLEEANLWQVDLAEADLTDARVHPHQLRAARSLAGATGPDGQILATPTSRSSER